MQDEKKLTTQRTKPLVNKMSIEEKDNYIKEHWRNYRKHCKRNKGCNIGFMFPDGSRITKEDASVFLYF
jgi:hypothetical protein